MHFKFETIPTREWCILARGTHSCAWYALQPNFEDHAIGDRAIGDSAAINIGSVREMRQFSRSVRF